MDSIIITDKVTLYIIKLVEDYLELNLAVKWGMYFEE